MSISNHEKGTLFRSMHRGPRAFVMANVWDAGTARIAAGLGFKALATSSSASAGTLGRLDGRITREQSLAIARIVVEATDLPVSADLENGFGDTPKDAAETIRLAGEAGLAGGSIEDASNDPANPLYEFNHAVDRVAAAAEAAQKLPFPFTFTARAENYLNGKPDLEDTIRRLLAYEAAGADVLFAPGLPDLAAVQAVCSALKKPVNFMVGMRGKSFPMAELEAAGVRRISLATSFYRAAMSSMIRAAQEIQQHGTFGYVETSISTPDVNSFMSE